MSLGRAFPRMGLRALGSPLRLVRRAVRRLGRTPGYTATSLVTLAVGIGASATIFSVLHATLLAPLPYPEEQELIALHERSPGPDGRTGWVSPLTFRDWQDRVETLDGVAGWRLSLLTWTGTVEPELLRGWAVTASFFPLLGVRMTLGRSFVEEEDLPGASPVVVLSHGLWERGFGLDPSILGRSLTLDGEPYTIVGVAPASMDFPSDGEYWVPLRLDAAKELRDFRYLGVVGRRSDGATPEQVRAELARISAEIAAENPETNTGWDAASSSFRDEQLGSMRVTLLGLAGAVLLLLLISVGNLANLAIARGVDRQGELALRRALGATGSQVLATVLSEAVLLAAAGGALGVALAWASMGMVTRALRNTPHVEQVGVHAPTLGFALALSLIIGVGLGLATALVGRARRSSQVVRGTSMGRAGSVGAQRARAGVLSAQVALALALVIGSALLGRSLVALGRVDLGFEPDGTTAFAFQLPAGAYPLDDDVRAFYREVMAGLDGVPGVVAAGAVTPLPLELGSTPSPWFREDSFRDPSAPPLNAHLRTVTAGYPKAMGIPLLEGRFFLDSDREDGPPVAVVNTAFVRRYLNGEKAVGTRITGDSRGADAPEWITVVGVVGDVRFRSISAASEPEIYLPEAQLPTRWAHLIVRSSSAVHDVVRIVSAVVHGVDPDLPLSDVRTGAQIVSGQMRTPRITAALGMLFATAATVLSVVGILGVLSLLVAQRIREIGLRLVVGATSRDVRRFVLLKGLGPVAVGVAVGLGLSVILSGVVGSLLWGMVSPRDPWTYGVAVMVFGVVAVVACLVPTVRAGRADPVALLRAR